MSKQIINIDPDNTDPHYRYKREKILVKHENANGASTRIINLHDIARALSIKKEDTGVVDALLLSIVASMKKKIGLAIKFVLFGPQMLTIFRSDQCNHQRSCRYGSIGKYPLSVYKQGSVM